jgi:dipeptidase E
MGSSAGTNMACPTLRTTNDMPIVEPGTFRSFGLLPFQINPHYLDPDPASTHMGETREKRIEQFLEENDVPVLGMREGSWLRRNGSMLTLGGTTGARLFRRGAAPQEFADGADLSFLLDLPANFDRTTALESGAAPRA